MYFVILATDAPGKAEVRANTRQRHREYLRNPLEHPVKVRLGGPTMSDDGKEMCGTLLVVEADDLPAVERFLKDDPYAQNGLFERVVVRPWWWTLGAPQVEA